MKRILLLIALYPTVGFCQGFLPRWEMSLSADANSYTYHNASQGYVALAFRPGFYPVLGLGLSVEPELAFGAIKGTAPAFDLSGNLLYNFGMGYWPVVPFLEAGYGVGNGIAFYQPMTRERGVGLTGVKFLNLGGGLKIMILGGRALLRVEYRYQQYSDFTYPFSHFSAVANRFLLGFGVLL